MLLLYWFGTTLESMYGSQEFLLFYLTSAVVAGLAFVGLDLYTGSTAPGIGASGAVMAVMMLYTMHFPDAILYIFCVIPVRMRWAMVLYAIWDLHPILLALSGDRDLSGVAHSAHLGGLAFGFLYAHYHWRLTDIGERFSGIHLRTSRPRLRIARDLSDRPAPEQETSRLDEVLAKISRTSKESLSDEELAILHQESERLRSRNGGDGRANT